MQYAALVAMTKSHLVCGPNRPLLALFEAADDGGPEIFHQKVEMVRILWQRLESVPLVEARRRFVFRVNEYRSSSDFVGSGRAACEGIPQQVGTDPCALL